jgi:adenylate cyclase
VENKRRSIKKWLIRSAIGLGCFALALILGFTTAFENLDLRAYNMLFVLRGSQDMSNSGIAVVAIDDKAFASLPAKWPYPREYFTRAITNLTKAGARLIVFDVTFTEPSRLNPFEDESLARAVAASGKCLLAGKLVRELATNDTENSYLMKPIPPLLEAGADWALIDAIEDDDGFIRRYLVFQEFQGKPFLSLATRAFVRLTADTVDAQLNAVNGSFIINGAEVPRYDHNTLLINFRGPDKTFPTYSLADVLDDTAFTLPGDDDTDIFDMHLDWGTFRDKVVFVGASAEELQDNKFTPFFSYEGKRRKMPGVETHANALHTLLTGDYIQKLPYPNQLIIMLLVSVLTMLAVYSGRTSIALIAVIAELTVLAALAFYSFVSASYWVPIVGPVLALLFNYGGHTAQVVVTERREKSRVRKVFAQYVAKSVVDDMLAKGDTPKFGGERRELTVLFSDVRGFTTFCEHHDAEAVVQRLNEYLTSMVDVVLVNQGTLDKFVGDELMAVFGAPLHFKEHAEKACVTACEMITRLRSMQKQWSLDGKETFNIGIGINTGTMIVGNLGSQQLFDYTVIGDEVNLGARLEGTNKQYGTSIIISEFTYAQVKNKARVRELDLVKVKGKQKPVKIYELRAMEVLPEIEQDLLINTYHKGLDYYKQRQWYKAIREFRAVLRYFQTDGPSRLYVARSLDFIENPPPGDWDGVYEFKTK